MNVGNLQASMGMDLSGFADGLASAAGSLDNFKGTINKITTSMTALMTNPVVLAAAAVAAIAAVGKACYDAYVEIDAAYDSIEIGTGAVGESLEGLQKSFDNVFTNTAYVESAEALAGTIADLNTYLGVDGEQLENLAAQFSNLKGMGMDASVDSVAKAFNRWGVSTEEMGGYLDYFYQLSQRTGISIDGLTDSLATSQATLSTFGFSLQESANLLAQMNKAGFEATDINTAFKKLTSNGVTSREEFEKLISSIKNATDQTEAITLATEAFGERAKDNMVALVQSGAFDELAENYADSAGAIENSAESTTDFADKMDRVGRTFTSFGAKAGGVIGGILSKLLDFFEWTSTLSAKLFEPFQKLFGKIGESFAKFWGESEDTTGDAISNIMGFIETLVDGVAAGIDWFLEFVYPAIEVVIEQIVNVIKLFSAIFAGDWDEAFKSAGKIAKVGMTAIYSIMEFGWNALMDGTQGLLQGIIDAVFVGLNAAIDVVESSVNNIIKMINTVTMVINAITGGSIGAIGEVSWDVATPQLPQFARFDTTGIGAAMQTGLDTLDKISTGEITLDMMKEAASRGSTGSGGTTVNLTQNFNTPVVDYYEVTKAVEKSATEVANSAALRY